MLYKSSGSSYSIPCRIDVLIILPKYLIPFSTRRLHFIPQFNLRQFLYLSEEEQIIPGRANIFFEGCLKNCFFFIDGYFLMFLYLLL